ncbi:uncharacterized protein UV8b_08286 [Ustilaginoidea virens]|uniref:Uncharacterized protein n=1 Tax=Ustilaginoidea virens TaxID=1159556 RepID=A0A8E5HZ30_USTVR|nr:uncharacterized protein UV8b_08286 [Ustilaginoidea virens]QUC24045.1 hypothetical protein UV8b_08286 [Ustilaginoidea virens]
MSQPLVVGIPRGAQTNTLIGNNAPVGEQESCGLASPGLNLVFYDATWQHATICNLQAVGHAAGNRLTASSDTPRELKDMKTAASGPTGSRRPEDSVGRWEFWVLGSWRSTWGERSGEYESRTTSC